MEKGKRLEQNLVGKVGHEHGQSCNVIGNAEGAKNVRDNAEHITGVGRNKRASIKFPE